MSYMLHLPTDQIKYVHISMHSRFRLFQRKVYRDWIVAPWSIPTTLLPCSLNWGNRCNISQVLGSSKPCACLCFLLSKCRVIHIEHSCLCYHSVFLNVLNLLTIGYIYHWFVLCVLYLAASMQVISSTQRVSKTFSWGKCIIKEKWR